MTKYKKKPVIIEAEKLTQDNLTVLNDWCKGNIKDVKLSSDKWCIDIETLEGTMRAEQGDYIIKGVKGEFYPCKSDIFEMSYEKVI